MESLCDRFQERTRVLLQGNDPAENSVAIFHECQSNIPAQQINIKILLLAIAVQFAAYLQTAAIQ
jgi:hypothetical protein